jgi:hypothetical protein
LKKQNVSTKATMTRPIDGDRDIDLVDQRERKERVVHHRAIHAAADALEITQKPWCELERAHSETRSDSLIEVRSARVRASDDEQIGRDERTQCARFTSSFTTPRRHATEVDKRIESRISLEIVCRERSAKRWQFVHPPLIGARAR